MNSSNFTNLIMSLVDTSKIKFNTVNEDYFRLLKIKLVSL